MEESNSFGVLGATGRGACEAAGLAPGDVEIICASMGGALASVGGFCVGSHEVGRWESSGQARPIRGRALTMPWQRALTVPWRGADHATGSPAPPPPGTCLSMRQAQLGV